MLHQLLIQLKIVNMKCFHKVFEVLWHLEPVLLQEIHISQQIV